MEELKKTCDVCRFDKSCWEVPDRPDANKCDGFSNPALTRMLGAIKLIEESKWLEEHDEELLSVVHDIIDMVIPKKDVNNALLHKKVSQIKEKGSL